MHIMKAKIGWIDGLVIDDRAISGGLIEKDPSRVSNVQLEKENRGNGCDGATDDPRADMMDTAKIDLAQTANPAQTGRCRRLRSSFCHGRLLSKTLSRKLNPVRSHIRFLHSPGCFSKKRPVTMFD
jgi:hypothetical protein